MSASTPIGLWRQFLPFGFPRSKLISLTRFSCAPPPGEQPPHAPRRRAAPSRAPPGVPSGGPVSVGHQRYGNLSCRGLENLRFRPFWRFWPKSTLSGPMHTQFPYRWWPTDTGPPEGTPGAARDGAKQRRGAWGGCAPGGGAPILVNCTTRLVLASTLGT